MYVFGYSGGLTLTFELGIAVPLHAELRHTVDELYRGAAGQVGEGLISLKFPSTVYTPPITISLIIVRQQGSYVIWNLDGPELQRSVHSEDATKGQRDSKSCRSN